MYGRSQLLRRQRSHQLFSSRCVPFGSGIGGKVLVSEVGKRKRDRRFIPVHKITDIFLIHQPVQPNHNTSTTINQVTFTYTISTCSDSNSYTIQHTKQSFKWVAAQSPDSDVEYKHYSAWLTFATAPTSASTDPPLGLRPR